MKEIPFVGGESPSLHAVHVFDKVNTTFEAFLAKLNILHNLYEEKKSVGKKA